MFHHKSMSAEIPDFSGYRDQSLPHADRGGTQKSQMGVPAPAVVAPPCPRCLMSFPQHVNVRARCTKRWRGHNFDAAQAQGAVGAAVARALGVSAKSTADLEAFYKRAYVKAYGQGVEANPGAAFDVLEGEDFEFHVGMRQPVDEETLKRIETEVREALSASRHFVVV